MTHPDAQRAFEEYWTEDGRNLCKSPLDSAEARMHKRTWDAATERAAKVCEEVRDLGDECKPYEDNHADGHIDGCNNCATAIRSSGRGEG